MKKIFAAILGVAFALSLLAPANAFFYPGTTPTDDKKFNKYGPMIDILLCTPYGGVEAEYLAFKGKDIDLYDWSLLASQVEEMNALDPNMEEYMRAFYVDRGMREFDLNNMRFPLDDVSFRQAISHCIDKDAFVATQLAGLGLKMDTPLQAHTGWANPAVDDLYPFDLEAAASLLSANGYTDKDADGFVEGPAGEEISLVLYARQDDPDRSAMGQLFATTLEVDLAGSSLGAGVDVDLRVAPKTECYTKCMIEFDYHMYTGGWGFGRDPTTLYFLYLGEEAQAYPYTANYPGYSNPEFDTYADGMLTAGEIGDPETEGTAKYYVYKMQEVMMGDAAIIPVFTYASYSAALVGWENIVNQDGVGLGTWYPFWTLLNTYKEGEDTLRWGFVNDVEVFNIMHGEWVWDAQVLNGMYDTLINYNPYDVTDDFGAMALSWDLGEWDYEGSAASYIEFHIREDMEWGDIAPKADRQTPGGAPLLVNGAFDMPVTAEDVAFSIIAERDVTDAWDHDLVEDVVYVEVLDPYTVRVYYGVYMPLWALHWVGGLPMFPKHVWQKPFSEGYTREFEPFSEQCLSGCSYFLFDYEGSSLHEYYKETANTEFYGYHPVDVYGVIDHHVVDPEDEISVTFYAHNRDSIRDPMPASTVTITITLVNPDGTTEELYSESIPDLPFSVPVEIFTYTGSSDVGKYVLRATITDDPVTGHGDPLGYPVNIWRTITQDINLDFKVNILDIAGAATAFGTRPGHARWDPKADINGDFKVDILDIASIALKFGWS